LVEYIFGAEHKNKKLKSVIPMSHARKKHKGRGDRVLHDTKWIDFKQH